MDAKATRKVIADMLDKLKADMMAAVDQMPDDWDETELGWYLVHRAEMFSTHHFANRIRRKAFGACGEEPPAVMTPCGQQSRPPHGR
jgi:hypothetical protein